MGCTGLWLGQFHSHIPSLEREGLAVDPSEIHGHEREGLFLEIDYLDTVVQ